MTNNNSNKEEDVSKFVPKIRAVIEGWFNSQLDLVRAVCFNLDSLKDRGAIGGIEKIHDLLASYRKNSKKLINAGSEDAFFFILDGSVLSDAMLPLSKIFVKQHCDFCAEVWPSMTSEDIGKQIDSAMDKLVLKPLAAPKPDLAESLDRLRVKARNLLNEVQETIRLTESIKIDRDGRMTNLLGCYVTSNRKDLIVAAKKLEEELS